MSEKEKKLRKLSGAQFAMWEIHIFLDTHPDNKAALDALDEYKKKYNILLKEYEDEYGPIMTDGIFSTGFTWVNDPWPWESESN